MINGVLLMTYISLLRKLKERCMEGSKIKAAQTMGRIYVNSINLSDKNTDAKFYEENTHRYIETSQHRN